MQRQFIVSLSKGKGGVNMLYLTSVNVSERCIDCKTLSGKWEIFYHLYYSVMITNSPIKVVIDE